MKRKHYDYLLVGAGLFNAVFAAVARQAGKSCFCVEKRAHSGGNIYCEEREGIQVHKYGAHIFHTSNKEVWDFVNSYAEFNRFTNSPVALYKGEVYNLPFNMNTFAKLWNITRPEEAERIIAEQRKAVAGEPSNLEEQAISLVGEDIYRKLIKGYTEKQWGRDCRDLPPFIIRRLPVRFTYDNNYFNDRYQGIPCGGYNVLTEALFADTEILLSTEYLQNRAEFDGMADRVIYTGPLDQFFAFRLGKLDYRSLRFETELLDMPNYQGNAVVNYTEREVPWTRIIEHKFFDFGTQPKTVITREYPSEMKEGMEPYYPVNDEKNQKLCDAYRALAEKEEKVVFGGRLGEYKYYDMDKVVESAFRLLRKEGLMQ